MKYTKPFLLLLLLVAAPLSAQQASTILVPDVEITNDHPITNEITIEVMTDSVRLERIAVALERLTVAVEAQDCNTCGGASTTAKLGLGLGVPILLWMAISLSKSANKDDSHTVNTEVNLPPPPERGKSQGEH